MPPPTARFDWPALLRAGLQTLGLKPAEFWSLTPAELALLLGLDRRAPVMDRARFLALAAQHPDDPKGDQA
ncbi:phage tail assembly chaperone [Rubellimicrobium aerolatum]|uniref:Phage tail assembly chaperone n=1 Tax=Rubellimicrobium aerolatum TaxID=490979 RepID=A0ABW0SBG4_9RHOB|nr:phage tail assembly chaperone [Rubellimicrobium aerolatum]MBP1805507.1 putative phage protein (TIGR02216 family) [Rubellimicrobium aerolatum]